MTKKILKTIQSYLRKNEMGPLHDFLKTLRPGDISEAMKGLDEDERKTVFGLLGVESASGLFHEVDIPLISRILQDWDNARLAKILDITAPDDGADVLGVLLHKKREKVLRSMDKKKAKEVQNLLAYDEKTAGGIMTTDFVTLSQDLKVRETLEYIRKNVNVETVHHLYIIDREECLVGVLPLRRLIAVSPEREDITLKDIMTSNVIATNVNTDQEEIAKLVAQHNLLALPVVDEEGRMVGRITVDDVIDVVQQEANEDFYKMAGALWEAGYLDKTLFTKTRMRLPWLLACLLGGVITGSIVMFFKEAISQVIILASFIPVIMAVGGSVGLQSSTIVIRGIATGHVDIHAIQKFLFKEISVGLVLGLICGLGIGIAAWFWPEGSPALGLVVGIAMFTALTVATTFGALFPALFKRLNVDPAVAAGPFITTVIDVAAIAIYLGLATMLLHFLV
ncbi:MAG TPA: magnesium transporter [bacterium]|nr:magnesium transporter [bacterium]